MVLDLCILIIKWSNGKYIKQSNIYAMHNTLENVAYIILNSKTIQVKINADCNIKIMLLRICYHNENICLYSVL